MARGQRVTYNESIRHAVYAIIEADLNPQQIRKAVLDLIPKEFHVAHSQP